MSDQKQQLETQLWNIANTLRGKMDADDFRDYILGFIFYKYLSSKMASYANEILEPDGLTYPDLKGHAQEEAYLDAVKDAALEKLGYFLKPDELFSVLAVRGNAGGKEEFILGDLGKVLTSIEQSTMGTPSEEDFGNLFEDLDLTSSKLGKSENEKNKLIVKVLSHLDEIDFEIENTESDILGDAYEYLIGQFASGAGKKAGEFYTPQQVSSVLAQLVTVGKDRLKSVYDPTCGSGSLLLRVAKEVKEVAGFYGQEMNPTTYNLCRMNMIMHDVHYRKFDIRNDDTLENPQHNGRTFEAIVANPPFSAKWSASAGFTTDERFSSYGKLPPSSKADFAFVLHMLSHLSENGTMAVVLPHGVLFRGAAEGIIRTSIIKDHNYLDAVIGLPSNIFYGTSIPTCMLVFRKDRYLDQEGADKVLFIDASQHFDKVKTQNVLSKEHIDKIVETYGKYRASATLSTPATSVSSSVSREQSANEKSPVSSVSSSVSRQQSANEKSPDSSVSSSVSREQSANDNTGVLEEKYSYLATLDEIAENDFNLNIPRYVDTFEEEEPVDLAAVSQELKALDQKMTETDQTIAQYCDELGIETPF